MTLRDMSEVFRDDLQDSEFISAFLEACRAESLQTLLLGIDDVARANGGEYRLPDATLEALRGEQIDEVLNKLTGRERDVLKMRFGLDDGYARTLEEVGTRLHVTRERVRQIELRALKKLRHPGPNELIRH